MESEVRCPFNNAPCGQKSVVWNSRFGRTLKALSDCNAALIHASDEAELLKSICRIIVDDCGHAMVWIGYAEKNAGKTVSPVAYAGFEKGYVESLRITWADTIRGRGPTGTAIRTGKPCVCRNMLTDPAFKPWRTQAVKNGYASSAVIPLMSDGRAIGAISIYSRQPDAFSEDEVKLLSELTGELAYGIAALRLRLEKNRAEEDLKESEIRYRSLFNGMSEGFALNEVICDDKGVPCDSIFLDINPAFERLTGLRRENVIGRLASEVLPENDPLWIKTFGEIALSGEPRRFENFTTPLRKHYEVFAYRPAPRQFAVLFMDTTERRQAEERVWHAASFPHLNPSPVLEVTRGGRITFHNPASETIASRLGAGSVRAFLPSDIDELLASPLREPVHREVEIAGQFFGETICEAPGFNTVRIFSINITEQKRAENELRRKTEELAEAVAAKNELLGIAAHDLRNPLFVLGGFCELLIRLCKEKIRRPILPFIEKMRLQTQYMSRLVDSLLDVTSLESGKITLRAEPTDLTVMLAQIVELQQEMAAGKNISIECRVPDRLPRLVIDRNKIEQVFNNLIINAIKFSPQNSTITLEAKHADNRIECAVHDRGIGIPQSQMDLIFKPFFKGRPQGTANEEGFGLGLAIAQKIATAHGGELAVESQIGNGSVFKLILPIQDN